MSGGRALLLLCPLKRNLESGTPQGHFTRIPRVSAFHAAPLNRNYMANQNLVVELKLRWWVWPYVRALGAFCAITGYEPDVEKLQRFILQRGITMRAPA